MKPQIPPLNPKNFLVVEHLQTSSDLNTTHSKQKISTRHSDCQTTLEYKSKKKIKIHPISKVSLSQVGRATINCNTFITSNKKEDSKQNNDQEFRTEFILKYAQNAENFYKTKKYFDLISETKQFAATDCYSKLKKIIENQNQLLLDTTNFSQKKVITSCCDYSFYMNKYCELIFSELQNEKERNMKLRKRNFELESTLTNKSTELNELKTYLNKYDVSSRITLKKSKEDTVESLKKQFIQKENSFLLTIRHLEEEITDLTILLNKNKEYYDKFKESEKKVDEKKRQNEEMRFAFNKELHNKVLENAICKDKQYELLEKIEELEKEIAVMKEESENQKRSYVELNAQMKKAQTILNEKNENIMMLNEEMENYYISYEREKSEHFNTIQALNSLEQRFYNANEEEKK